jgi:hypothetical protein
MFFKKHPLFLLSALPCVAAHHGNGYHWARTANPFTLQIVKSVAPAPNNNWQDEFDIALAEWSASEAMHLVSTSEDLDAATRQTCPFVEGKMRVCNYDYGYTGWAGIATWSYYTSNNHIVTATAKLNDYYTYNSVERRHLMCHEMGHPLGLGHSSTDGSSQGTCMDYALSVPSSQSPSTHDYEVLTDTYAHLDSTTTYAELPPSGPTPAPVPSPTASPSVNPTPPTTDVLECSIYKNKTCKETPGCSWTKGSCNPSGRRQLRPGNSPHQELFPENFGLPAEASQVTRDRFSATFKLEEGVMTTVYEIFLATPEDPTRHLRHP